jgi:hypothetical protein
VEGPATFLVKHLERDQGIVLRLRLDAPLPPALLSRRRRTPVPPCIVLLPYREYMSFRT